jgi:hypothetical protein
VRLGLGAAAATFAVLSMGFQRAGPSRYLPYRLLYELAPGWQGIRTPSRLMTLTTLALALLAAGGAQRLIVLLGSRRRWTAGGATVLLAAGVLVEGYGVPRLPRVPAPPSAQLGLPDPQLHLPFDFLHDQRYMYWSVDGFPRLVNGLSGFEPRSVHHLRDAMRAFPDAKSVATLRRLGVRTVVLHPDLVALTPWRKTQGRPHAGLPVVRQRRGDLIVYRIAAR